MTPTNRPLLALRQPLPHAVPRRVVAVRLARLLLLTASLAAAAVLVAGRLSPHIRIGINASDSLPGWVYVVYPGDKANLRMGDTIGFNPPANPFYRPFLFIKQVAGVAGDTLSWGTAYPIGTEFYLNGKRWGLAKAESSGGAPLRPTAAGVIPDGSVFVWTPHPDSFDSRYADIGLIPDNRVVGRAHLLF